MRARVIVLPLVVCFIACQPQKAAEAPSADQSSALGAYRPPTIRLKMRGTNLSGAEFGSAMPGVHGKDYQWPKASDADYFIDRGMNHLRVPLRHERLQPALRGALNEDEWVRMKELVDHATGRGATVMLEPHNSFRFNGRIVSELDIGDFWGRVAARFKDNDRVQLNTTNEPHDMNTEVVVGLNNASLREIRRVGFKGLVLVPGNGWTGGSHWTSSWYGTSNATAMLKVVDPGANMAFEVHQYLDSNASGGGSECVSSTIGVERLTGFVAWLRANGRTGWLGEIGAPNTETCRQAVTKALEYVEQNYDVWRGWNWWGSGVWSFATTYPLSIGPTPEGQPEKPMLGWLKPFIPCSR